MLYIFLAMILYGVAILTATAASRHITNTNVASAIINVTAAAVALAVIVPVASKKLVQNQKFGVVMAVTTGVLIAFFVMAVNKAYAHNKIGIVAPVVFGGAIFLSTLLSYFVFKEKVTQLQLIGLILLAIGFGIITYARATAR